MRRVLIVRLRSIGDTVLCTPSIMAIREFLPDAQIDILLEDWVAPLLDGFDPLDNVLHVGRSASSRLKTAADIRRRRYDVVFNLHGGTTGTFFAAASGARHKIGFSYYRYRFLYSDVFPSGEQFWDKPGIHSAEQQLALLGSAGVPVRHAPPSKLAVTPQAEQAVAERLNGSELFGRPFVLMHPAAAFATKEWATENFARTAEFLFEKGFNTVAVSTAAENPILRALEQSSRVRVVTFDDLSLPQITALASMASLFVGNDSGIAHIAAAVGTPPVVIFGSSNIDNWRPWTRGFSEVVLKEFHCQPCPGYKCGEFGEPRCIQSVSTEAVFNAIERVLAQTEKRRAVEPAAV